MVYVGDHGRHDDCGSAEKAQTAFSDRHRGNLMPLDFVRRKLEIHSFRNYAARHIYIQRDWNFQWSFSQPEFDFDREITKSTGRMQRQRLKPNGIEALRYKLKLYPDTNRKRIAAELSAR